MILFLDIDGVLHPLIPRKDRPASEAAQLSYLPRLAGVLFQHSDIRIVISSTWRVTRTLDQLRAKFPLPLQHRLIGMTPVLDEARFPGGRELEALEWLDVHAPGEEWIALDDCAGDALERLNALMNAEVPRFSGCVMLMALTLLLKARQSLKLEGDSKPAYSFLESFLAFQPEKKDETDRICIRYLRNRAGDLSLWYVMPALLQHGYKFVGEPVVVTGDRALHRVIFRVIPPVAHESRVAAFTVPPGEIDDSVRSEILRIATEWKPPQPRTSDERSRLMKKLFELAADCCECDEEKETLMVAWSEWFLPGEGMPMKF